MINSTYKLKMALKRDKTEIKNIRTSEIEKID